MPSSNWRKARRSARRDGGGDCGRHAAPRSRRAGLAILLDHEGIIVCNLEHRILLYNQAAARILNMRDALGLGRSLFGLLAGEPILQMLELLQHRARRRETRPDAAERASVQSYRFVCATVDVGTLLEIALEPRAAAVRAPSGYVLSFADIGRQIENLALRDAILRETMVEWRRPLAISEPPPRPVRQS